MSSTNAHQIKNNIQNSLCGLGDKIRRLTAGVCLFTQIFSPSWRRHKMWYTLNLRRQFHLPPLIENNTVPYTLGALESAQSVADRFGISLEELRRLNQFRTFARGFDNVRQGENWMFRQQPRRKVMSNKMPYRLRMAKTRWRIK